MKPSYKANLHGYNSFRSDNPNDRAIGGVVLFISSSYPYQILTLDTNLQAVAVRVHVRRLITVCTVYLPPSININSSLLQQLLDQLPTPFILIGDVNAHSCVWGSHDTNARGRIIDNIINDNGLCILNNGDNIFFHEPTGTFHAIDLAICSPSLYTFFNFWVGNDLYSSDHFPVFISLTSGVSTPIHHPTKFIYDAANWPNFTYHAKITAEMVEGDIDEAVDSVTKCITHAADTSIPKSSKYQHRWRPWWNENCRIAKKKQKKAWNIFRRYPSTQNLMNFKRARADARRERRKCQRESWISYVSSITCSTPSKELWKRAIKAMGIHTNTNISCLNVNNNVISSPFDIANVIGETLSKTSSSDSYQQPFKSYKQQAEKNSKFQ